MSDIPLFGGWENIVMADDEENDVNELIAENDRLREQLAQANATLMDRELFTCTMRRAAHEADAKHWKEYAIERMARRIARSIVERNWFQFAERRGDEPNGPGKYVEVSVAIDVMAPPRESYARFLATPCPSSDDWELEAWAEHQAMNDPRERDRLDRFGSTVVRGALIPCPPAEFPSSLEEYFSPEFLCSVQRDANGRVYARVLSR